MTSSPRVPLAFSQVPDHVRLTDTRLTDLVLGIAADRARWQPLVRFGTAGSRWWTRLRCEDPRDDESVDVWLLTWLPGHATDLHDHGSSSAAFVVVGGELEEVRAELAPPVRSTVRSTGSLAVVAPGVVHDVRAHGQAAAVSIHAYSPPLTTMTYYEHDRWGVLRPARTVATHEPEQEAAA